MSEDSVVDADRGLSLIPEQASDYAAQVDYLYFALLGLSGVLILVLVGLIVVFGLRYHRGRPPEGRRILSSRSSHRIEIGFAVVLGVLFMGVFFWAGQLYTTAYGEGDADTVIRVVGKQWMWKVQHPDGTREINTLHVPVGEAVQIRLTSQDVIHSFAVPALRLKRDAVPGMYTTFHFTARKTGEFRLFCAEYCGDEHARMRGRVVVLSRADYQQWLDRNGVATAPAEEGRQLFQSYGCSGCHYDGASAPTLGGLYGRVVPLANGDTVTADEAYIRDSIVQPQKHIVAGFDPIMPSFSGQISESEIYDIIAYIRSLKPGDWTGDDNRERPQ